MKLNPQQLAAVHHIEGPLLLLAGAGSGKTRVITHKIAYLIEQCGHRASHIYAVTFTNKAANEMRARIQAVLPAARRRGLHVATFHTLGLSMIKRHFAVCERQPGFSIMDAEDCIQLIRRMLPSARANDREEVLRIQQQISRWKNELLTPDTVFLSDQHADNWQEAAQIFPIYQQALQAYNAVDFDDLIQLPVHMLQAYPEILSQWQRQVGHLLVDEYQDSNTSQYALVKLLVRERERFTVVGDDDQSIYAWRGAKPENLVLLQQDFPRLTVMKLEQNYRSTGQILQVANQLIANNAHIFPKKLWSNLGRGEPIRVICCQDEQDEADQVVADLISHKLRHGTVYADYAILYRGNHQARIFEKRLRHHGIAYRMSGGQSWFARTEVKDLFAYFKLLCNPQDDASFLRVINTPKRGIGDASIFALVNYAQSRKKSLYDCCDHLALTEVVQEAGRAALLGFKQWFEKLKQRCQTQAIPSVLRELVDESGYEAFLYTQCDAPLKAQKRMEAVWELVDWIERLLEKEPTHSLHDVINKLILIDILEQSDDSNQDTVQLMTLHASKGLEFPYVYLVGMEEELLPHRVSIDEAQIDEERRLAYVGITRAQKALCLTLARQRRKGGELQDCAPSRFLDELPKDCLEWFGQLGVRDEARSKALARAHLDGLKHLVATR